METTKISLGTYMLRCQPKKETMRGSQHVGRGCCNIEYSFENYLKLKSREFASVFDNGDICPFVFYIAHIMTIIVPCHMQNFKTSRETRNRRRPSEFSRYFSLGCVLEDV